MFTKSFQERLVFSKMIWENSCIVLSVNNNLIDLLPNSVRWQRWSVGAEAGKLGENVWVMKSLGMQPEWVTFRDMWKDFIFGKCLNLARCGRNERFQNKWWWDAEKVLICQQACHSVFLICCSCRESGSDAEKVGQIQRKWVRCRENGSDAEKVGQMQRKWVRCRENGSDAEKVGHQTC